MDVILGLKVLTLVLGFYMAWNIGANDVANAMGTSVGSKALSLKKAVLLAAILEFSGAFFVGSSVSETIQNGIVDPGIFSANPMIFVLGMMGAMLATSLLLQLASYYCLPISTTHSIVGAVVGFGIAMGGVRAIQWNEVSWIAASWVLSPLLSGMISYFVFFVIQKKILQAFNPLEAAFRLIPRFVFLCFFLMTCTLLKGDGSWIFASFLSGVAAFCSDWVLRKTTFSTVGMQLTHAIRLEQVIERAFISLQILSACLVAFAHGANDVANAIGPVAAVFGVLTNHSFSSHVPIPTWLLLLGGAGVVIGLATWGWRVIETVGKKITELTPAKGFAAEFGAAATILLASKLGLPISTTHALVGAIFGVGLAQGLGAINLKTLKEIVVSWLVTIPLCAILSIAMFYLLTWIFL